jgi:hypothetical protein
MNLPAASCRVSKDFLPVTARSVVTRQSHCKRLLRFARNDPLYDDQTVTLQQATGNYQVKELKGGPSGGYKKPKWNKKTIHI